MEVTQTSGQIVIELKQLKKLFLVAIFPMYQHYFLDKRHNKQIVINPLSSTIQ
jgi:hypothetical protein